MKILILSSLWLIGTISAFGYKNHFIWMLCVILYIVLGLLMKGREINRWYIDGAMIILFFTLLVQATVFTTTF